jgi:hypothetical protein
MALHKLFLGHFKKKEKNPRENNQIFPESLLVFFLVIVLGIGPSRHVLASTITQPHYKHTQPQEPVLWNHNRFRDRRNSFPGTGTVSKLYSSATLLRTVKNSM